MFQIGYFYTKLYYQKCECSHGEVSETYNCPPHEQWTPHILRKTPYWRRRCCFMANACKLTLLPAGLKKQTNKKKSCQFFLQEQNNVASHYPVVLQCAISTHHQSVPTRRSKANLSVLRVYQTQHHTDPSNEAVFNTSDPAAANARNKFTDAPCRHPRNT